MNLREWTVHYIKARDAMQRALKSLDEQNDKIVAQYKEKDVTFLPMDVLSESLPDGNVTAVCLQNKKNFSILVKHFSDYAKNQNLTIIFVNVKLNEKWLLKPAVHYAVADKTTLKTGLQSMYDTVPE